jgi:myo-inositol-1(or 4)-monophosphatase
MEFLDAWIATFRELVARTSGVRRAGSAALDLAHVACGRLDGFWEFGLSPWDIAAGCLLIEEAGGLVSDFAGESNFFAGGNVLCGNPRIHAEMLRLLPPLLPEALKK